MAQTPSLVTREAGTSPPAGRKTRRLSVSHLLVALVVVLAFVLNILALQDRDASTLVAVAASPITAGSAFSPDMVRLTPIPADFEGLESLVGEDSVAVFEGWIVRRAVAEGGVIDVSLFAEPGASTGRRAMSLPIEPARSAGGTIVAGDVVDVISARDGTANFVVTGVEVIAVSGDSDSAFGAEQNHLVVAVTAEEALALAAAMEGGSIDVIRATGAPPVEAGGADES